MSDQTGVEVKCPHCGTEWALDEKESKEAQFTCGTCGKSFDIHPAGIGKEAEDISQHARLTDVVMIVLRLYAIWLCLEAVNFLISMVSGYSYGRVIGYYLFACAVIVLIAVWMWRMAPRISRWMTRGNKAHLDLGKFSIEDLYCFAFLLVGLYNAVDALGPTLTWLHYNFLQSPATAELSPRQQTNYYTLFHYLVRLLLGLALIFKGRIFAAKLMAKQVESSKS